MYYRMLQIMLNRYREAYSSIFTPNVTLFCIDNIILGVYGIIKLHDQLAFDKFMNFPIMVTVLVLGVGTFYPKNATIYERTKNEATNSLRRSIIRARWGRGGQISLKEIRCVSRSCPILGVPFGSLYLIKRSTVLSLFDFIACNTVSALITYP